MVPLYSFMGVVFYITSIGIGYAQDEVMLGHGFGVITIMLGALIDRQ